MPPGRAVHEPPTAPPAPAAGGPHDPIPATASHAPSVPAAAAERVPSTTSQFVEHSPVREPLAPNGASVEPAPAAGHSSQPAPSVTSTAPHLLPAAGRPPEPPGGGWHGHGDGGHPDGTPPHGRGPHGPDGGHPSKLPAHDGVPHGTGDRLADHDGPADGGNYSSPSDGLTSDDLSALTHYTGSGYIDLNDALRSDILDASQHVRVEALNNALAKLPPYEGAVVRGSNLPPEALAQYRPGEYVIEKGFMSTTTNPAVAQAPAFAGNVEFRIFSCTGRDISAHSMFPAEQEVLFPAHTRFFVVDKTVDPLTGRTIIEMVEE
ncbi:ADP-ribosyltransferase domain-containing protein [Mycobacterium interjectum]|uniref:ADP-ribosyltransferase domain-containing protein n=1 Tax=Mycobacterium interjectum TaxID=33895 RepID=UPI002E26F524|nr:ADP-ribosyltransferase domain-containing protein [Mycobacterium interjectum]